MRRGIVYLIGAGPGDPKLITVRGLECLRRADVVVYDHLSSPQLLEEAKPGAETIYAGKTPDRHTLSQEEINRFLVEKAQAGKIVARLKGGDPFVFGRGGEEAEALARAGVAFAVVPGVTSAIAAPAYAGIPVTHRGYASTFAVITGHEDQAKGESSLDWEKLATGVDTLIFLMGVSNLPYIVEKLMTHGRSPETPAALICWGTTARQETVVGTLADIAEKAREARLKPPAVIVVGEVVNLRKALRWFESKPLFGQRVLVTRARPQASILSEKLRELGAAPIEFPVIEIAPLEDYSRLDEAIRRLSSYDWAIFTSVNGVKAFMSRLWELGEDVRALHEVKLCAIGPATAAELERYYLRVDYMPEKYMSEAILRGLGNVSGQRILLPRAEVARKVLSAELCRAGAVVDEVATYRIILADSPGDDIHQLLLEGQIDVITFTSSSTVRNFAKKIELMDLGESLKGVKVACIGPITAGTAEKLGIRVDMVAEEYTIDGLIETLTHG